MVTSIDEVTGAPIFGTPDYNVLDIPILSKPIPTDDLGFDTPIKRTLTYPNDIVPTIALLGMSNKEQDARMASYTLDGPNDSAGNPTPALNVHATNGGGGGGGAVKPSYFYCNRQYSIGASDVFELFTPCSILYYSACNAFITSTPSNESTLVEVRLGSDLASKFITLATWSGPVGYSGRDSTPWVPAEGKHIEYGNGLDITGICDGPALYITVRSQFVDEFAFGYFYLAYS